jgi:hypothetical protein
MERTYNQELIIALNQEQRNELTIFMDWLFFISKKKKLSLTYILEWNSNSLIINR